MEVSGHLHASAALDTAPRTPDLGTRRRRMASPTPGRPHPRGKRPQHPTDRSPGGPQGRVEITPHFHIAEYNFPEIFFAVLHTTLAFRLTDCWWSIIANRNLLLWNYLHYTNCFHVCFVKYSPYRRLVEMKFVDLMSYSC